MRAVAAARELGARDAMCPQLVEKVSVAGHCDVVYISELGCGINRGAMSLGRLYQVRSGDKKIYNPQSKIKIIVKKYFPNLQVSP